MKLEGRIDKKKKRASRRVKFLPSGLLEVADGLTGSIRINGFKRPKLTHDMSSSFLCTPKQGERSPTVTSGL